MCSRCGVLGHKKSTCKKPPDYVRPTIPEPTDTETNDGAAGHTVPNNEEPNSENVANNGADQQAPQIGRKPKHCSKCGKDTHNARTCPELSEEDTEEDVDTTDIPDPPTVILEVHCACLEYFWETIIFVGTKLYIFNVAEEAMYYKGRPEEQQEG
ncbi:unnamed protein product [Linum trigynum]|uniref:CCHC-type domain-containing protein n=1 Tax=Linum trigynum TaxID=586398 RepID=A0AAV2E926_9ROSI